MDFWISFWFILGCVLIGLELFLPGGVAFFIGAGALFVAVLHLFELIDSPLTGFTLWFILSTIMMFTMKGVVDKFLPNTTSKGNTNEDLDAFGEIVEVVEEVSHDSPGRIEYLGSSWPAKARNPDTRLMPGSKAKLIFKDNLTWLVEPVTKEKQES